MAKIEGAIGHKPPPGAPHEVSQPLRPELIQQQQAQAAANEKQLAPFNPQGRIPAIKGPDVPLVKAPRGPQLATPKPSGEVEFFDEIPAAHVQESTAHQPAASNSDSPSRGIPRPQAPDKTITGGWGALQDSYEPLNGDEVRSMALVLMDDMVKVLQNDLRFTLSTTYPRVEIELELKVNCYDAERPTTIRRVQPATGSAPLDVAKKLADQVVFVIIERRREFNEQDESETPANAMREEIGSEPPRKQYVEVPGGKILVDTVR